VGNLGACGFTSATPKVLERLRLSSRELGMGDSTGLGDGCWDGFMWLNDTTTAGGVGEGSGVLGEVVTDITTRASCFGLDLPLFRLKEGEE